LVPVLTTSSAGNPDRPRIVLFCVAPGAYRLLRDWAARAGYSFRLIVTTPGPTRARTTMYREIIAEAPADQDFLITTRFRRAAPQIAALEPDLVLSFTLPYRLPAEILAIPRHGAVNLHPSPLPEYRGPDPARMVYNGESKLGATLHRTAADYDTGAILSRQVAPMPPNITPKAVLDIWNDLTVKALDEGVPRALADDPGTPQDSSLASYAASFSEHELWQDWNLPARVLQRRVAALNLFSPRARATIGDRAYCVTGLTAVLDRRSGAPPGTALEWSEHGVTVQTADGVAHVTVAPLP
jgi:methionyl-tRNA formyltransferase